MDPFPEEVRRFMEDNLDSVDQLEVLRVLGEDPAREWLAIPLAHEVQAPPDQISRHLEALHARGLLTAEERDGTLVCRYGPHTKELEARLQQMLQLYRQRPVTMIKMVYARARDPLRSFAEAFRLRKED